MSCLIKNSTSCPSVPSTHTDQCKTTKGPQAPDCRKPKNAFRANTVFLQNYLYVKKKIKKADTYYSV